MAPPARPDLPAALDPSSALAQLNDGFREYYAARQRAVLAELGPAIACIDDSMIFRRDGRRLVGPLRTRRYHALKTICHLPLTIQTIVGDAGGALTDEARARLGELQRRASDVLAELDDGSLDGSLDAGQIARQRGLIGASLEFIAAILEAEQTDADALGEFLRARIPDIERNIDDAARDQLQTMHATLGGWVEQLDERQWSRLLVVVGSAHMARTGNVASQYFSVVLGEPWAGRFQQEDHDAARRVLTSEDATDEDTAFALLATHVFDRRAANAFFGEQSRLSRDVLADAAERQLEAMFGPRPARGPAKLER